MNPPIPPHQENADTFALHPLQMFDVEVSPVLPGTKARPRPAEHPRPGLVEEPHDGQIQEFEWQAVPAPPGTKAKPRPPGRERERFAQPGSPALADPVSGAGEDPGKRLANHDRQQLAVGDLVSLRSGGPAMTVLGFTEPGTNIWLQEARTAYVWCAWFQNSDFRREVLPRAALVFLPRPDSPLAT